MNNIAVIASIDFQSLFTSESRNIGGTASVVKSILCNLDADNIVCFGFSSSKNLSVRSIVIGDKNILFVPLAYLGDNVKIPKRIFYFFRSKSIGKRLKEHNITAFYSHSFEMSFWISKEYPVIEHMHGAENAVKKSIFSKLRLPIFQSAWEGIRGRCLSKAKKIVAIDELCFELAAKYNSQENILRIPNFVDTNIFYFDDSRPACIDVSSRLILFVGRIEEVKGLELFVDIVRHLNLTSPGWTGVIVGKGSYQKKLEDYVRSNGLTGSIIFAGAVYDQDELRRLYSSATVLLMTSYHEGIPMTALEALACGTPVVSTDVGGIKSLATKGVLCTTIESRNVSDFSDAILSLEGTRSRLTSDEFPFNTESAAKKLNKIFRDVARKNNVFAPISLPPPMHGSNLMNQTVVESPIVNEKFNLTVFPISYNRNSSDIGLFSFGKVVKAISNFLCMIVASFKSYDLIYYSPAVKGLPFYRDLILLLPFKIARRNIVIHLHGKGINKASRNSKVDNLLYRYFFKNTSVICLSSSLACDVKNVFSGPVYIVNNGIRDVAVPTVDRGKRDTPVVLFLSNLIESKGVFVVLGAASILKNKGVLFRVNLVGAPRGEISKLISGYITKNKLEDCVSVLGPKYGDDKAEAFADADIFVFPTQYEYETWGLVVNEAMQASLPVITSTEGSLPEIVDDGITGFLLEKNTPEHLAKSIEQLILDPDLRIKMGEAGYEKYREHYTSEIMERRITEVFSEIISAKI